MSVGVAGLGWVTPLGSDLEAVRERIARGDVPTASTLTNAETGRVHPYYAVLPEATAQLARLPRMRRSSVVSYLAVAAALAAIADADASGKCDPTATAVVFAISDGGVIYTRRFFEQVVKQGANAASPLLFPETVYNAPASHLAALLGIDGSSYTLVGDASIGLSALHFAQELLLTSDLEQVVVVGTEECDWILCEAYRTWRLARTPLAEGAAALVLRRTGRWRLHTHPGASFARQGEAAAALREVCVPWRDCGPVQCIVGSANGTFIDRAEAAVLGELFPQAPIFHPKKSLGEAPGASALLQTIFAALQLDDAKAHRALVSVVGFNQQANAALLERA